MVYLARMSRGCIFGCEKAGSGEHVFPATLGGRRVNKGILCDKHNNDLAPLAGVLSDQLRFLNALIGVRPDHNKKRPHSAIVTDPNGLEYIVSTESFRVKGGRTLTETLLPDGRTALKMEFGTQEEADQWIKEQEETGISVEPVSRVVQSRLTHDRFRAEIKLGGPEGLRAVGYVALTFLTHRFPEFARSPSLDTFRHFILKGGQNNDFVWWLPPPLADESDPYEFGHKVEISVPQSGDAVARVTLFSCLSFGICFGSVTNGQSVSITTHIDPLATNPPDDVQEQRHENWDIGLIRPASQAETLRKAISTGAAKQAFDAFMKKVTDYRLQEEMRPLHSRLTQASGLERSARKAVVDAIIDENAQRILNLIRYISDDMRRQLDNNSSTARIIVAYLDMMFPEEGAPSAEFEVASGHLLSSACAAIANAIDKELEDETLDLDRLCMILGGGPGAAIVGEEVFKGLTG